MWSIHKLRTETEAAIAALSRRGDADIAQQVHRVISLDAKRRSLQTEYDTVQARSKQLAKQLGEQLRRKPTDPVAEALRQEARHCKTTASALIQRLQDIRREQNEQLLLLPNAPHPSVPDGRTAEDHRLIRSHRQDKERAAVAVPRPHWDLLDAYGLDFKAGSAVTGSGFVFFKGSVARLVRGLIQFFLDKATEAGFEEIMPPLLVNEAAAFGTGQLPDKEGQMYRLQEAPYYLIPTAEVPITNLWREQIIPESQLPLRYTGHTPCFRREAGSWGADVRGLNRLHQFDKVEIVQICTPERSYELLEEMAAYVETLLEALELPYRLLQLCVGDLGFASAMTYDFEVYAVAQKRWLEVSSVSNFESFQARRMQLRYRTAAGDIEHPHTLNGSALAIPRILACLLEYGQRTHEIRLPAVLKTYTGFDTLPLRP